MYKIQEAAVSLLLFASFPDFELFRQMDSTLPGSILEYDRAIE